MTAETASNGQEFAFQAEITQLLHLLAHSLYQSKDIALRELISNASDALDKWRYVALTDESRRGDDAPLAIALECRKDAKELVVRDNGIGMNRDELVTNLGTIAHSGSRAFIKSATEASATGDLSLIGQFGVGFYAAFMIADKVRVRSRAAGEDAQGWEWESDGRGSFRVTPVDGLPRGTEVVLHLKDDAAEFAEDWKVKSVVKRYSSFVPHPITLEGEVVNDQKPIWVEPKSQVTEEQYRQFYQHLSHRPNESPLWHVHLAADSPIQFRAIVYCPPTNPELFGFGREKHGLNLCAKRVLVEADCRELVPEYLRFLYGVVDSEDLPLNVSRETLQDNSVVRKIRGTVVKQVFDRLDRLSTESPQNFLTFYRQFGNVLKEGVARDMPNRDRIARLLRFVSTHAESPDAPTSLADYVGRSKPEQKSIYYLGGPDLGSVKKSPNLEIFKKRGIEVIFLTDPVDEFVISSLGAFEGRPFVSIDSADLGLPETAEPSETTPEPDEPPAAEVALARVLTLFREALGERVKDVRESKRLTVSPCCLVNAEAGLSVQMQRLLQMTNKEFAPSARALEINPNAPLIRRLATLTANPENDEFVRRCGLQLWANALLLEGALPEPEALAERNQEFMEEAARKRSAILL